MVLSKVCSLVRLMHSIYRKAALLAVLVLVSCVSIEPKTSSIPDFVRVENGDFLRGEKPYQYLGVNMWYGGYLGSTAEDVGDRQRLINELDLLQQLGVQNIRVLGGSEQSTLRDALRPAIRDANGITRPDLLEGLDFFLAELAKREMTAVIYLTNFWEWSGGMATAHSWNSVGEIIDPSDPAHPWPAFALYSAKFYQNEPATASLNQYISQLLQRTNTVTGIAYKDDPTIMSWQLANEPRPGHESESKPYLTDYYDWVATTTALIKQYAPKQLVSIGSEGVMGCLRLEECVVNAHKDTGIDYMTFHMWVKNWGWFDVQNPESSYELAMEKVQAYISQHQRLARELNMPLVLEEFGMERDGGLFSQSAPVVYRDAYLQKVFGLVEASIAKGQPLQGTNVWAWGGFGYASHNDFVWRKGDKGFVGDPPQEPQGLNSIFSSDDSTLLILRKHAENIDKLVRP